MAQNNNCKPNVSVIIPVFNCEKYISRCVASVLRQTLANIEVILVDDGSTDNTSKICDELMLEDNRVKVIHIRNSGPSHSRNVGLKIAQAEYVGFVDADDWILPEMYEELYNLLKHNQAELCTARYAIVSHESETIKQHNCSVECYTGIDKMRKYLELGIKERSNLYSACTKLYKKNLFNDISFPENQRFEDMVTNYRLIEKANILIVYNKLLYFYFMNTVSITRNKCKYADLDLIKASKDIYEFTKGTEIEYLGEIVYERSFFSLLLKCLVYGMDDSIQDKNAFIKQLYTKYCFYYPNLIKSALPLRRRIIMPILKLSPRLIRLIAKVFC